MASTTILSYFTDHESIPTNLPVLSLSSIVASVVAVVIALVLRSSDEFANVTLLNPKKLLDYGNKKLKNDFLMNGGSMLKKWFEDNPDKPVILNADVGPMMFLPASMATEIRNDDRLSFTGFTEKFFHTHLRGFESFGDKNSDPDLVQRVVVKNLTKELNKVTQPLAEETSLALASLFTDNPNWHNIHVRETILRLIARISSRVFLGEELCRNEDWLKVTREYTVASFNAADTLRKYPYFLRPFMNLYLPECRENRRLLTVARQVVQPLIEGRRKIKAEAKAAGKPVPYFNDAVEWFELNSKDGNYDPAIKQIVLSVVAIHTTTDLASTTLTAIAQHPEIVEPLRNEIVSVLRENGWTKTALYKMKLLDSVIKESQRMKPIGIASMIRVASEKVVLSDGTTIPKNGLVAIPTTPRMWDETLHARAREWDGYRFYNMRNQPDKQHLAQLVTTSPDHLAFGHGQHACPGRFFAANEVKMVLVSVLLKYDILLPEGEEVKPLTLGLSLAADPFVSLSIRRRKAEVEF